jgi:hypothetical protein
VVVPMRFQLPWPAKAPPINVAVVSRDGGKAAILAGGRLWVHSFVTGEVRDQAESRGYPIWSPDGEFIGYAVERKIMRIAAAGGSPLTVAEFSGGYGGAS